VTTALVRDHNRPIIQESPAMAPVLKTILYPVENIETAKAIFTALTGDKPHADQPYYVGFQVNGTELGLVPNGHQAGMTGPTGYWHVTDIRAHIDALTKAGATLVQEPKNVGGGRQTAIVNDADGNAIGLIQD
jgi:predicted enzyme related to lactoylglutathione lyase